MSLRASTIVKKRQRRQKQDNFIQAAHWPQWARGNKINSHCPCVEFYFHRRRSQARTTIFQITNQDEIRRHSKTKSRLRSDLGSAFAHVLEKSMCWGPSQRELWQPKYYSIQRRPWVICTEMQRYYPYIGQRYEALAIISSKKTKSISVHDFHTRVNEICEYFPLMLRPRETNPVTRRLPPSDDEITILHNACPKS